MITNHPNLPVGVTGHLPQTSKCSKQFSSWEMTVTPSTPVQQLCGQPTSTAFCRPSQISYVLSRLILSSDPFDRPTELSAYLVTQAWLGSNSWTSRELHGTQYYRPGWTQLHYLLLQGKKRNPERVCNALEAGFANQFHNKCISLWSPLLARNRIEAVFCFAEISTFKTCSGFIISARACTSFLIHCCKIQRDRTVQKITAKM